MCFATQEGDLSCFNQPRRQFSVFSFPGEHFSPQFGSQEGTLVHVLAPKRALYHDLISQGGTLACILTPKRTL